MSVRLRRLAGLAWTVSFFLQTSTFAAEDVAATLHRQTQEMVDAISTGGASVWERYLEEKVLYTTEDGTVLTKSQLVKQTRPLPEGVSGTIRLIDFKVAVHGPVAVASYVNDEHETYHGHELHCQVPVDRHLVADPRRLASDRGSNPGPAHGPAALPLDARQMEEYSGRYALTPAITYEIRRKAGGLEGQQTGHEAEPLRAEAPDVLFVPGKPRYRMIFRRGPGGRITGYAERREAWDLDWTRLP